MQPPITAHVPDSFILPWVRSNTKISPKHFAYTHYWITMLSLPIKKYKIHLKFPYCRKTFILWLLKMNNIQQNWLKIFVSVLNNMLPILCHYWGQSKRTSRLKLPLLYGYMYLKSRQDKPNHALWSATRVGKIALSCLLRTSHSGICLHHTHARNKEFGNYPAILTTCLVNHPY